MAAFSAEEEAALLMSKLTDPSITSDSGQGFRDRVMGLPPPDQSPSFLDRLAGHPLAGVAMAGPGAPGALVAGLVGKGIARHEMPAPREMKSFTHDNIDPEPLKPMANPDVAVQPAPPLAAGYGRAGTVGAGGFGGASSGGGLGAAWHKAQDRQLGALDERKSLEGDLGVARAGRVNAVGDLEEANALKQQRDAENQQKQDEDTHARFQKYLDQSDKYVDDLRNSKVDPSRLMRNADGGMQFQMAIGSMAGGFLSGLTGGPNRYLDRLDKVIDRDIKAQETDLDTKKAAINARNSTFGQMIAENGDRRMSSMQTKNLMYEAAKMKLKADSDRLGIPEIRAQSLLAINEIEQKQAAMDEEFKKHAFMLAQQQAAAGAAAQRAAEQRAIDLQFRTAEFGLKVDAQSLDKRKLDIEERKLGGDGGLTKEDAERMRALTAGHTAVGEQLQMLAGDNKGSMTGAIVGVNRIPGTDASKYRQGVEEWNTRATLLLGPIVEAMNKGKPGAVEMHDLQKRILVDESMSVGERTARTKYLQKLQQDAAATMNQQLGTAMPASVVRGGK